MEKELITVVQKDDGQMMVSAKALHQALGVGRDFSNWLKGRVSRYGFELGVDLWPVAEVQSDLDSPKRANQNDQHGGDRKSQDYWLTLDMAKELAMLERTEAGRRARKYFLECERQLVVAQAKLIELGIAAQEKQRLEQPQYRLSEPEREQFLSYMELNNHHGKLLEAIDGDLEAAVLPYILGDVLRELKCKDRLKEVNVLAHSVGLHHAKRLCRSFVVESDVAYRLKTDKVSPRLLQQMREQLTLMFFGTRMRGHQKAMGTKLAESGHRPWSWLE